MIKEANLDVLIELSLSIRKLYLDWRSVEVSLRSDRVSEIEKAIIDVAMFISDTRDKKKVDGWKSVRSAVVLRLQNQGHDKSSALSQTTVFASKTCDLLSAQVTVIE